ncbi:hypothetical protein HYN59_09650 [Flavobacterium album]|uniref:Uncharacterized protein n=1 Tax=Flavobacterium album TaxID=2175091 RepID=A0A2S1QYA1_9FLAO|nr:DUF6526 family protein [Flavobacterium album]AWH85362.1 hypothetical protein HYN59_09650 [Flavobacterium album]
MAQQSYKNHIRWYPPHHFIFYPLMMALFVFTVYQAIYDEPDRLLWGFLSAITAVIIWVAFMLRQHYALTLQNRIVIGELRYRYFVVTGQRLESLEEKLTEGQLFALRFAPDEELAALAQKAISENLSSDAIKKSIKNWKADHRRV